MPKLADSQHMFYMTKNRIIVKWSFSCTTKKVTKSLSQGALLHDYILKKFLDSLTWLPFGGLLHFIGPGNPAF
jgi:hypothetical protein